VTRDDLPRGVFAKGRRYYLVTAEGKKRVWHKLSRIDEGLPAMFSALAAKKLELAQPPEGIGRMPAFIAQWERDELPLKEWTEESKRVAKQRGQVVAEGLADFEPSNVDPPACTVFLGQFRKMPRTFNAYRSLVREYMRYAEQLGRRPPGSNPTQAIKPMRCKARDRYITDSELRRIKVAAMRWDTGKQALDTRSGPMLCALIDMAYLTGQAISDLLDLEWKDLRADGIIFARGKVEKTTGAKVLIGWTTKLRDVERRLKALRKERRAFGSAVFVRQDGQPLTYWGVSSAWQRARLRAGITDCTFHDLKAKALTDKEEREGMRAASAMGQHATEGQTADYVRRRKPRKTGATR
jgi:integrase